jgi:hypothetical protein
MTRAPSPAPTDIGIGSDGAGYRSGSDGGSGSNLLPITGIDLAEEQALIARHWMRIGLGFLSLSLVVLGFALRRKPEVVR